MTFKKTTKKTVCKKQVISTHDKFMQSLTPAQKKEYYEGYRDFLLSELLIAIMKEDAISVHALAKEAGLSHDYEMRGKKHAKKK